jgi:hypothetical protein
MDAKHFAINDLHMKYGDQERYHYRLDDNGEDEYDNEDEDDNASWRKGEKESTC